MADETTTSSGGGGAKKQGLKKGQREFGGQIQDKPEVTGAYPDGVHPEQYKNSSAKTKTVTIEVGEDIDPEYLAMVTRQLSVRRAPIVGNFADLQRLGAAQLSGEGDPVEAAVLTPPQQDGNAVAVVSYEDTIAPGPSGMPADVAEEVFGSRVAQGDRPELEDEK